MTRRIAGLLAFLLLLTAGVSLRADATHPALAKAVILEGNVAYLRVDTVAGSFTDEITAAQHSLTTTNKIAGIVLDLRFAGGDDLAAAKVTDAWLAAKKLPLAILVNGETRGAALALATDLRAARAGLVFGGAAGELQPDIAVTVAAADERDYLKNPYAALPTSGTNASPATNQFSPFIDHTSEADLVRAKIKDGEQIESMLSPAKAEPQIPYLHDPVLARAVDLIKALALRRRSHT